MLAFVIGCHQISDLSLLGRWARVTCTYRASISVLQHLSTTIRHNKRYTMPTRFALPVRLGAPPPFPSHLRPVRPSKFRPDLLDSFQRRHSYHTTSLSDAGIFPVRIVRSPRASAQQTLLAGLILKYTIPESFPSAAELQGSSGSTSTSNYQRRWLLS